MEKLREAIKMNKEKIQQEAYETLCEEISTQFPEIAQYKLTFEIMELKE